MNFPINIQNMYSDMPKIYILC